MIFTLENMSFTLIEIIILCITWVNDRSGIRKKVLEKLNCKKKLGKLRNRAIADPRIELYKTMCYVFIALFWGNLRHIQLIIPLIILVNIMAYIRYLVHPELIKSAEEEKKAFPTLDRMFIVSGINLGLLIVSKVLMELKVVVLIGGLMLLLFIPYMIRGYLYTKKIIKNIPIIAPIFFFAIGCIYSINSFYGVKYLEKKETVVEDIHIGIRADGFSIPEEDGIDGETSFSRGIIGVEIGDKVEIVEREGCLGIRWFTVYLKEN